MFKSLVVAMAVMMVQSHVFAAGNAKPNQVVRQMQEKRATEGKSSKEAVPENRKEIADVIRKLRALKITDINSDYLSKVSNVEVLNKIGSFLNSKAALDTIAERKEGISKTELLSSIDILAKVSDKLKSNSSTTEVNDSLEAVHLVLASSLPEAKIVELGMTKDGLDSFKRELDTLLNQDSTITLDLLTRKAYKNLKDSGKTSVKTYEEWIEAILKCLRGL